MYALKMFSENLVVINDYENIKYALITKGHEFSGRPKGQLRVDMFGYHGQNIAFGDPDAPFWAIMRKAVHRHIKMTGGGLSHVEEVITLSTDTIFDKLLKLDGKPTDIRDSLYNFTIETMIFFLLGDKFSKDREMVETIVRMEKNASSA